MHTTVKVSHRDKGKLERLRGALHSRTGRRLTQQETLSLLLSHVDENASLLAADLEAPDFPLSPAQLRRLRRMRRSWGRAALEEGVDTVVYG